MLYYDQPAGFIAIGSLNYHQLLYFSKDFFFFFLSSLLSFLTLCVCVCVCVCVCAYACVRQFQQMSF